MKLADDFSLAIVRLMFVVTIPNGTRRGSLKENLRGAS